MPPEIKSGLLDMESRSRRAPAPRHPKLAVETPPAPDPQPDPVVASAPVPIPKPKPEPVKSAPKASALRAAQVYLDSEADAFVGECRAAGTSLGSADVSASAVIRLALRELSAAMTAEEVAGVLLGGSAALRRPGRKRL
jgi:hypothetical protein